MRRFRATVSFGLVLTGLGLTGCAGGGLVGKSAPVFTLKDLAGQDVSLTQFRGQPVLLSFWAAG